MPDVSSDLHLGSLGGAFTLFTCLAGLAVGQVLWGPIVDRLVGEALARTLARVAIVTNVCAVSAPRRASGHSSSAPVSRRR
ncbi:MAG: hypothetical protein QM658_11220 [Gordonia sp. (in: high G+C Gram-positive bacteria)]